MNCPLCSGTNTKTEIKAAGRIFRLCDDCSLIFSEEKYRLSSEEEKKRYSHHQNSIEDIGYINFLKQIIEPAIGAFNSTYSGLDYGCGPNPVLAQLVELNGFKCAYFDPYFYPQIDLNKEHDFIFATECFEHFFTPANEMEKICSILKPGGILAIMTEFWTDINKFPDWYYVKDPTHVCFYHANTLKFISKQYGFEIIFCDEKRVVVMRRGKH